MEFIIRVVYYLWLLFGEAKDSFFGVSYDTIFTVFVTISIFILGYILSRWAEQKKEERRLEDIRNYFIGLLDFLEMPIRRQIDALLDLNELLKEEKDQHIFANDVSAFNLKSLTEISNQDLYKIFILYLEGDRKSIGEQFGKLRGQIDYLGEIKESIRPFFKEFSDAMVKYDTVYKVNLKASGDLFDSWVSHLMASNINIQQVPFLANLDQIRANWLNLANQGHDPRDRYITKPHYLIPVRDLCLQWIGNDQAMNMLKLVQECLHAFDNMEETRYVYRRHFLLDARGLQKALIEIKAIVKGIRGVS